MLGTGAGTHAHSRPLAGGAGVTQGRIAMCTPIPSRHTPQGASPGVCVFIEILTFLCHNTNPVTASTPRPPAG
jgi:hypothetical protein